jgi:hypothetical protein
MQTMLCLQTIWYLKRDGSILAHVDQPETSGFGAMCIRSSGDDCIEPKFAEWIPRLSLPLSFSEVGPSPGASRLVFITNIACKPRRVINTVLHSAFGTTDWLGFHNARNMFVSCRVCFPETIHHGCGESAVTDETRIKLPLSANNNIHSARSGPSPHGSIACKPRPLTNTALHATFGTTDWTGFHNARNMFVSCPVYFPTKNGSPHSSL